MSNFEHISADTLIRYLKGRSYKWAQVHHTWSPDHSDFTGNNHMALQQGMRNYHVNTNGWSDIGQHVTLFPDGTFVTGRPFSKTPAGIKGYNTGAFMIEIIGNFDKGHDKLDGKQLDSALKVYNYLVNNNGATIMFHNEKAAKSCPGTGVDKAKFIKAVRNYDGSSANVSSTGGSSKPVSKPSKTGGKYTGNSIVEYLVSIGQPSSYGERKKLAIKHGISNYKGTDAQNLKLLGILRDGKSKPSTPSKSTNRRGTAVRAIQRKLNRYKVNSIRIDSIYGPATHKALVKAYQYELNRQFNAGLTVDGIPGPATDRAAVTIRHSKTYGNLAHLSQAFLYFKGENLKVDGYWQNGSINATKSFQRKNGLTVDGVPGQATFKKLIRR